MIKKLLRIIAVKQTLLRQFLLTAIPSIMLLVVIAVGLLWFIHYESSNFYRNQQELARSAVTGVVHSLQELIANKRDMVTSVVKHESPLLQEVMAFPDNDELLKALDVEVTSHLPDHYSYQISDASGLTLLKGKEISVTKLCQEGLRVYAEDSARHDETIVMHGNSVEDYHYDVMARFGDEHNRAIFFISFGVEEIVKLLSNSQVPGQALLLVKTADPRQIELSTEGVFTSLWQDEYLSDKVMQSILYQEKVAGSGWSIVSLPGLDLFVDYKKGLYRRIFLGYLLLLSIVSIFIWRLWHEEKRRFRAEDDLKRSRNLLEVEVERRTRKLERSERDLQETFMSAPYGMVVIDKQGVIESINNRAEQLFGYSASVLKNKSIDILLPKKFHKLHVKHLDSFNRSKKTRLVGQGRHLLGLKKNGEEVPVEVELSSLEHSEGEKIIVSMTDVSKLLQAQQKLMEEHERATVTLNSIADGVITTDINGEIQTINPVAEKLTGWIAKEAIGRHVTDIYQVIDESTGDKAPNPVVKCLSTGAIVELGVDTVLIHKRGMDIPVVDNAAPIHNARGRIIGVVLVFHDASQSRAHANEIQYQANHDPLTGLVNRREFDARLKKAVLQARARASENVLLFLDLDRFKLVNDSAGHAAGDELLKQVTRLMSNRLRKRDTLARLGGDEFAVLLQHCPGDEGLKVANSLRSDIQDLRFFWEGQVFNIGVSIGMVSFSEDEETADQLLNKADAACYSAKESGRNRVQIYDENASRKRGETAIVNLLVDAFENDRMRLYQQQIRATDPSEAKLHCEVLVRLLSESGDVISPGMFLPAAERYGLATTLDKWVIKTTIGWLARHQHKFADSLVLAINLSGQSITDSLILEFIKQQIEENRIAKGSICFEITETAAMTDITKARHFIQEVKQLGCQFSLDDFGSGHASYAHLKNMPVDFLKIDGMFVKDIPHDPIDYSIVKSMNEIGQVLGMKTIAEFAENDEVIEKLLHIGVDFLQGYGVSRPAPIDDLLL